MSSSLSGSPLTQRKGGREGEVVDGGGSLGRPSSSSAAKRRATAIASHKQWLLVTFIGIFAFGPLFALASVEAGGVLGEPARWTLDLLSWPLDGAQNYEAPTTRFLTALTGGFLTGYGVTVLLIRQYLFDAAPEECRKVVVGGVLSWFVVDSTFSILSGNASNAAFNVLVLFALVGPMWRPASH